MPEFPQQVLSKRETKTAGMEEAERQRHGESSGGDAEEYPALEHRDRSKGPERQIELGGTWLGPFP